MDGLQELGRAEYRRLLAPLRALPINALFARSVLEKDVPGRVFATPASSSSPGVGYVIHRYGMSLLFGDTGDPARNERILTQVLALPRAADEWLQAPDGWAERLSLRTAPDARAPVPAGVERYTRVNFAFSPAAYRDRRQRLSAAPHRVERVGAAAFAMPGSVVPRVFFRDLDHFIREGVGFAVMDGDTPASLAFSSFSLGAQLELGIETLPSHRGRGLAALACAALIDDCLARELEPIWSCRLENAASYQLAQSLGFAPVRSLPYFRLRAP